MITRDVAAFVAHARALAPDFGPACAAAAFLVTPEGFALAAQSASDNAYMDLSRTVDPARALDQHRALQRALSDDLPVVAFPGDPAAPDGLFPNNVFATAPGRLLVGRMRHPVRQREAERADIRGFFRAMGRDEIDLRTQPGLCELTGSVVIDRARGIAFAGLGERCDEAGAAALHAALGLRATLLFDLAPGEYHANVVMSVLAGRALVVCPDGFADPGVATALAALYAPAVVVLDAVQKAAFAGNCLALAPKRAWFSAAGAAALRPDQRAVLAAAGLAVAAVPLDEIEKAGGSLRCCVAEIY
ncbi:MAG TPA: arginine deiminase-related protein [Arenimonas sp.]|uniref:arginine deiminase-related protein n=1 Tax=Arenimonas sp. TaxID=1872635 RepID=UPI002D7E8227|nr:arginine deiminase-related protein [Arenimonas sp.]HEU0152469.1 arginine deiminase-related protein [Arenimonas sp.]